MTYPGVDLALVLSHDGLDVLLHDALELGLVLDGGNPGRQLGVPDSGVTTDELVVGSGVLDKSIGSGEGELALLALGGIPLHGVLRGDLTEVGVDDGGIGLVVEGVLVGGNTDVLLALGHELLVDGALGTVGAGEGATSGSTTGGRLHDDGAGGRAGRSSAGLGSSSSGSRGSSGSGEALGVPLVGGLAHGSGCADGLAGEAATTTLAVDGDCGEDSRAGREREDGEVELHLGSGCRM